MSEVSGEFVAVDKWGVLALLAFVATIPAANWTLDKFGFWDVPWLGPVASGVVWVGLAFVLRDIAQRALGSWWTWAGIVVGAVLSWWLATPELATASVAAFTVSEGLDWAIYTPLARRHFLRAVALSSWAGAALDSAIFVRLAFHSYEGWWQLAVAKCVIVAMAAPLAWRARVQSGHAASPACSHARFFAREDGIRRCAFCHVEVAS